MATTYNDVYAASLDDPTRFWGTAAEAIQWDRRWDSVRDDSNPPFYRWFVGGRLNTCYNALDVHIERGRGKQAALVYDSPVTNTVRVYTYAELRDEVAQLAGALVAQGVEKGDRVIIYMPMVPEAAMAMLACARIGAVHSVVFGGFAPKELSTRIDDAKPKLILSASCGVEGQRVIPYMPLLNEAISLSAHTPDRCLILQRPGSVCHPDARPRHRLARRGVKGPSRRAVSQSPQPTPSTFCTRQEQPASPRVSCVTTAVTRSR